MTRDSKTAAAAMGARRATSRAISGIRSYSAPVGAIGTTTCVASARARSTMPSANGGHLVAELSESVGAVGRGGGLAYAALEPRAGDDHNDRRQRSRRLST
jgi:hypothetical protein